MTVSRSEWVAVFAKNAGAQPTDNVMPSLQSGTRVLGERGYTHTLVPTELVVLMGGLMPHSIGSVAHST